MRKLLIVFGTRPEAIKMAPLVKEFEKYPDDFETMVCVTGQHREMLDQVLELFGIIPDFDLNIMKPDQDLYALSAEILTGMRGVLNKAYPDCVIVHGDTTTSTISALAAFYQQIPVAHIEAGLRTNNIYSPWPEEMNRSITGRIATWHFAPTERAKKNLMAENITENQILVTGNTVIDALHWVIRKTETEKEIKINLNNQIAKQGYNLSISGNRRIVLITGHRRENFGQGFINICQAIKNLSLRFPDVDFVYPVHLNPNVKKPVEKILGNQTGKTNVYLIKPLQYLQFIWLISKSYLVLTDSGGIQEEAPGLGKPVLVMRDTTERQEAIEAGTVQMVGTKRLKIEQAVNDLLTDSDLYQTMSRAVNPYGDGKASGRIVSFFRNLK